LWVEGEQKSPLSRFARHLLLILRRAREARAVCRRFLPGRRRAGT
jgi:hypothetical protein